MLNVDAKSSQLMFSQFRLQPRTQDKEPQGGTLFTCFKLSNQMCHFKMGFGEVVLFTSAEVRADSTQTVLLCTVRRYYVGIWNEANQCTWTVRLMSNQVAS